MSIKVQPFVIHEQVLDLIGNEFRFDHAKGLAEWIKNSCDAYLREQQPDDEQFIYIRLSEDAHQHLTRIECIDFVGMQKRQIDDAFKRFFDPQAAKVGAKDVTIKTLGGHGNGGKFYMRQMFKTSMAITYRNGKMNIFGFNSKKQYGFEEGFDDRKMTLAQAMERANIHNLPLPPSVEKALKANETGFTVVIGEHPQRVRGTAGRNGLVDKLLLHPQARRLMDRKPITVFLNKDTQGVRLKPPKLSPKEGFESSIVIAIPDVLLLDGKQVEFKSSVYPWAGRLVLKTSAEPLRGPHATLNTVDFMGEVGVIGSYRIHELGPTRYSAQAEFIYGECDCPILEDPEYDSVRNDRQKLLENDRTLALLDWVRIQLEALAEKMETKNSQEKQKQDLKNTSQLNEILNKWKNRFMGQVWAEMFAGKGPAGSSGDGQGGGGDGKGSGGSGEGGGGGRKGGSEGGDDKTRRPRFPQVLISGQDNDPLDPLATEPFSCDPRHPAIYQRPKDVPAGIYWINTSRPLARRILSDCTADSTRWREYLFQRYIDIIVKEGLFQLGKLETSLDADKVSTHIDDVVTRVHDQAAQDLGAFLFEEAFGVK